MSELIEILKPEFQDKEYRDAYAEDCLNTMIASQIKALREQRQMTQKQLADATGMGQPRIPVLEDASYENWSVNTLKRLARAFDVALSVKFESFSHVIEDFENMNRDSLCRPTFAEDIQFRRRRSFTNRRIRRRPAIRYRGRRVPFPVQNNAIVASRRKGPSRALHAYENAPNSSMASQYEAIGEAR
jgi:transcriptional regulator with XRE-family HTH domain